MPYRGKAWYVATEGANEIELKATVSYAYNVANIILNLFNGLATQKTKDPGKFTIFFHEKLETI